MKDWNINLHLRSICPNPLKRAVYVTFDSTVAGALDPPHITKIEMLIGYTCDIQPDLTKSTYRVKESGTEKWNLNCTLKEFKFYASGFDTYNGGRFVRWDTQGTARTERPIPWRPIAAGGALIKSVFDQICQ